MALAQQASSHQNWTGAVSRMFFKIVAIPFVLAVRFTQRMPIETNRLRGLKAMAVLQYSSHPDLGYLERKGQVNRFHIHLACSCLHVVASPLNESETHLLTPSTPTLPINLVILVLDAPEYPIILAIL